MGLQQGHVEVLVEVVEVVEVVQEVEEVAVEKMVMSEYFRTRVLFLGCVLLKYSFLRVIQISLDHHLLENHL